MISLLIYLFLLINPQLVHASPLNLLKDVNNPLNTNFFVLQSAVTKLNDGYAMWFTGHNGINLKIGYATSSDGINWPSYEFVSVNDSGDNHDPSIFKYNGTTYIYYISEPSEGSGQNIQIKRSAVNGSYFENPETISLQRQSWNSQKLSCPYGYFENGMYYLYYCGTDGGIWTLGMATSLNGIDFIPCHNNPIITGSNLGNPQIYTDENGSKHLIFHSSNGIEEVSTNDPMSCNTLWTERKTILSKNKGYDQWQIIAPSLISNSTPKELFYTAKGPSTDNNWRLNRAVENTNRSKIVIIPGFFASWNGEAMLHNQTTLQSDWKIPSYIQEYEGLTRTLDNLGYVKNVDYYVFPYDWRTSLNDSADQLHAFLQTNVWDFEPSDSVSLIGHSMGGLLGRIYAQKYTEDSVSQIVTVGTPHKGVVQVYSPLEAGETKRDDSFLWLGTKLLINLNRKNFKNDRQIVQTIIPSLYNLFPTFEFLRTKRGTLIPLGSLTIQNTVLQNYRDLSSIEDRMTVQYGTKTSSQTPNGVVIGNRALVDHIADDYHDGRPIDYSYGAGDYLVPTFSSQLGSNQTQLPLDHGELIYTSESINQILSSLKISLESSKIVEGKATQISPSILIAAQSPIEIELEIDGITYFSEGGMIFLPDAPSGTYKLHVKKLSEGDYTITLAQIAETNDIWEQFSGQITENYIDEEDIYTIRFDKSVAKPQISNKLCSRVRKQRKNKLYRYDCKIKKLRYEEGRKTD